MVSGCAAQLSRAMSGQLRGRCQLSCSIPESYRIVRGEYGSQKLENSFEHSDSINQRVIWEKSLEDVAEGYAVGPFYEEGEVECILGTPSWIAMPRFPVLQADKVRPVDDGSGTGSCANSFSYITEKLQVPTADRDKLATAHGQFIEPRFVIR